MTDARKNLRNAFAWLWSNRDRLAIDDYRMRRADLLELSITLITR